ncbi:MAG: ATP-dependent Clp protease proteolytic subunit, partial [Pseudothermotoga sp.]
TKGKRFALPNARIMLHQPLGGAEGPVKDVEIITKELLRIKNLINTILSEKTGQPLERIERDTDRDFFMDAYEALNYGLIDRVIEPKRR